MWLTPLVEGLIKLEENINVCIYYLLACMYVCTFGVAPLSSGNVHGH